MQNEILISLREAAKALRADRSNGRKAPMGRKEIKQARESLEMTQEEFAEKIGVSVQTVRSWEQGFRKPGALSLALLGALLAEPKRVKEHV
jgi:putative transcriptional regulator